MKRQYGLVVLMLVATAHLAALAQPLSKPVVPPGRKNQGFKDSRIQEFKAESNIRNAGSRTESARSREMGENLSEADRQSIQLAASVISGNAVRLYWNDLAEENSYRIVWSTNPNLITGATEVQLQANTTTYLQENLQPGLYYYRIEANTDDESRPYSNVASVSVAIAPLVMADGEVTTCNKLFLDPGGLGDYADNEDVTMVVRPSEPGKKVRVTFQDFRVLAWGFALDTDDKLEIFDGTDVNAPRFGSFTGLGLAPTVNATSASGALTFRFTSGFLDHGAGWQAQLYCVTIPSGLQATASGQQVNLTWQDNTPDETGYSIHRRGIGAESFYPVATVAAGATAYTDQNVPADNRYEYNVHALGSQPSYPAASNIASAVVGRAPFVMREGAFSVCGQPFLDPGGNGLYPLGNPDDVWTTITTVLTPSIPGAKVSLDFSQFDLEEDYDYLTVYDGDENGHWFGDFTGSELPPRMTATNPEGKLTLIFWTDNIVARPGWRAEVSCLTPPAIPGHLTATATNEAHIRLTWTDEATDETAYVIERTAGSAYEVVGTVGPDVTVYDEDVPTGKTYTYRLKAVRGDVQSNYSNVAQVALGNAPLLMQNGTFTVCNTVFMDAGGDDDFHSNLDPVLTLTPDVPGNRVSLQFRLLSLDNNDKLQIYDGPDTQSPLIGTYMRQMLPPGIVATNPAGSLTVQLISDGINPAPGWEALVECIAVPATPGNLQAQLNGGQVDLTWDDLSDDETGFVIERATGSQYIKLDIIDAGMTAYTDAALPADRTLTYRVRATRDDIASGPSNTAAVDNGTPPIAMHNGTITACHGILRDPGVDEAYGNEIMTLAISPDVPGKKVVLTFSKIDLGQSTTMGVYNGGDTNQSALWNWYYWVPLPQPIQSVESNGRLTVLFRPYPPDPRGKGWEARISCVDKGPAPILLEDKTVPYVHPDDDKIWINAAALMPGQSYAGIVSYTVVNDLSSTGEASLTPNPTGFGVFVNVTKVGTIKIKASLAENQFYAASEKTMTLTVNKGIRRINFSTAVPLLMTGSRTLTATVGVSNKPRPDNFTFEILPPLNENYTGGATLDGPMLTPTNAGYIRIKASLAENDLYLAGEKIDYLELRREVASITFADLSVNTDSPPVDLNAQAYDGAQIFYSIAGENTGGVSLSGPRSQTVIPVWAGTVTLKAFLPESTDYTYAEKQATLTITGSSINRMDQTIDFGPLETVAADAPPFLLEATATSGLPVSFRIASGPATLSDRRVTLTGQEGTVEVEAAQQGNAYYRPAVPVVQTFIVRGKDDGGEAVTGIDDPIGNSVYLSPNPASTAVTIRSTRFTMARISVTDMLGRSTDQAVDHRYEHRLETGGLSQGVYIVTIGLDNNATIFRRLVIK